ncbi:MAG: DUF86 domain-containing protein [Dethiobacter sp.]|jgi:uncharacterized protein YutE (UPF0331/DUF86 family)|nr:DUF86 domain-containing protein [Dethiobacter sp.]
MVNEELLDERLSQIRTAVLRLSRMKAFSREDFLANPDNFAIAEHHLRRSLEALFDIGRHIIAKKGYGKPENYKQIIEKLGQYKVISPDFAHKIQGMAGYRNRLVHGYVAVSPEEIYSIIENRLDNFQEFCTVIAGYIEENLVENGRKNRPYE